jgi:hypothetical protein
MRVQELREVLRQQPFQPFRLVTTDGASFEVRRPDLCMFGVHGTMLVGIPPAGMNEPMYERHVTIDLSHIVRLEQLGGPAAGNGSTGT